MYSLSKEESDRIRVIKLIAIILVVYLHSYTMGVNFADGTDVLDLPVWLQLIETGISQIVAGCSVQTFFLLSAVLLSVSEQRYSIVIRKKARTLLLPYLIWNTFWIVVFIILQSLPFTSMYFSGNNTPILQCTLKEWFGLYGIGQDYPQCYPLWFVRDLMVMILFFPAIKAVVNKWPKIMMCLGVILTVLPFSFYSKTALSWFLVGTAITKIQIRMALLDKIPMLKMFVVYFVSAIITLVLNISVLRSIFTLIGILFWIRLSKEIYSNEDIRKKFLWMSQWTFMIYVLHELTLSSIRKICLRLFPTTPGILLAEYLLIPILVIAGCMIAGMFFKKIIPKVYVMSTGER